MKSLLVLVFILLTLFILSCDLGPVSPRGFSLPKGDVEQGKLVFLKYKCLACHKLSGVEQSDIIDNPELSIRL